MGVISVLIFEFATRGGSVSVSSEGGHVRIMKGEEYETTLAVESRGNGWIGSTPTSFDVETGQLMNVEPLPDGMRIRLRFLGKYAGQVRGGQGRHLLHRPAEALQQARPDRAERSSCWTRMPLSLLAPEVQRRLKVIGFGEQPSGIPRTGAGTLQAGRLQPRIHEGHSLEAGGRVPRRGSHRKGQGGEREGRREDRRGALRGEAEGRARGVDRHALRSPWGGREGGPRDGRDHHPPLPRSARRRRPRRRDERGGAASRDDPASLPRTSTSWPRP